MGIIPRRESLAVAVGPVTIGGGHPVVIQSMTTTRTGDFDATLEQIRRLADAGCELVRVAVPDETAARTLARLAAASPVPLVADIHFNPELALLALEAGVAKIRINPGNIGGKERFLALARVARSRGAAMRVGVNAGSLDRKTAQRHGGPTAAALVESARQYLDMLERIDYRQVVVSLKGSDVPTTIKAYRLIAGQVPYPLHLGITEAGPPETGIIKSAVGLGALLAAGIGDTMRVSLTADPVLEVRVAQKILQSLGLRTFGPELISCPTCGRCEADLVPVAAAVEKMLGRYRKPFKVAVMGCAVNGPGEAREADIGISVGRKKIFLFRRGKIVETLEPDRVLPVLQAHLDKLEAGWD
jgi:(E)-4-hydroxy-3-methylbut-2-enyl-diphosphate synthase